MIGPAKIYFIIFGLLTIVGGVMGYAKAGSVASVVAGSIFGILLLVAAFLLPSNLAVGLALALLISIGLACRFVPAFMETGQGHAGRIDVCSERDRRHRGDRRLDQEIARLSWPEFV